MGTNETLSHLKSTTQHVGCAEWLTDKALASILGCSVAAIRRWRLEGRGPKFYKLGGKLCRYSRADLADWISEQATGGGR